MTKGETDATKKSAVISLIRGKCMHTHTQMQLYMQKIYKCIYTYKHMHSYLYIHICIYTYMCIHPVIYIYTYLLHECVNIYMHYN